jgi:hypothetical protein
MADDYIEVGMLGVIAADPSISKNIANIYQFRRLAVVAPPSKAEINTAFQASIGAAVLAALNVDYTQTFNTVRFFDNAIDPAQEFVQAGVGAIAGERQPDYVTATVRLKASIRSRSGRGRKSYSPITEADTTGDNLTAGAKTRFDTVAAAILAGFTDASGNIWKPVIKSSKPPAQYTVNPVTLAVYDVISATANINLGILKRRKVKV